MTKFILAIITFLAWLWLSLSPLSAESLSTQPQNNTSPVSQISISAEDGWPPFADQYGKGISHQIVETVFKQNNIKVRTVVVPYSRALMMAESGEVDAMFNISRLKETENKYVFGKTPLFITQSGFYHNIDKPIKYLQGRGFVQATKLGVIRGFEYDGQLDQLNNVEIVYADNQYQLINLLLVNRIDTALMYEKVADSHLMEMKVNSQIKRESTYHKGEIYLGFSKQRPNAEYLAALFDKGLSQLQTQKAYLDIIAGFAAAPIQTEQ